MKNTSLNYLKKVFFLGVIFSTNIGCDRELSEENLATYSKTAEVFIDTPVAMGTDFYFPYGGAKPSAWSIDSQVSYKGSASMRFDVPNATDPEGTYAGGIFRVDGAGRNLTDYDALTFWAKASQGVTIGEFGFGEDFFPNKYMATITNVSLSTAWTKYIIPIPDASKLLQERGMFRFSAGTQGTNGYGYTFWVDELKFEKLGTLLLSQVSIMNGLNVTRSAFVGVNNTISGISATFNMPNGNNQIVSISPSYLNFTSSNPTVASVDALGVVTALSAGTATITATFGNSQTAIGSLIINCLGNFTHAPTPTTNAANVISIFSNQYSNVPVDYYNGYWQPYQTTQSADFEVNGDNILNYTNFNFVGIQFATPTINATSMTHLRMSIYLPNALPVGANFKIRLVDFGSDGVFGGGNDTGHTITYTAPTLVSQNWINFEIPLASFTGLASRAHLAQLILEGANISSFYADNIYFRN